MRVLTANSTPLISLVINYVCTSYGREHCIWLWPVGFCCLNNTAEFPSLTKYSGVNPASLVAPAISLWSYHIITDGMMLEYLYESYFAFRKARKKESSYIEKGIELKALTALPNYIVVAQRNMQAQHCVNPRL